MANLMRWRYGDTNPVLLAVDAATVIEIGDLVYLDGDDAKPAAAMSDQGTASANQQLLHDNFAGVAMQRSQAGQAGAVRVATTGVFEFDCDEATFEVGDLLGPAENASGDALENQKLTPVGGAANALGRCAVRAPGGATSVTIDVVSSVMKGGVQAVA
jgi:hypothetical protein